MAPKRGGSSGSSSGSGSGVSVSCPNAFSGSYSSSQVVYFAAYCLFFVLTLAVAISLCCIRKRHGNAKKLVGSIYLLSLLCTLTGYALRIVSTMLLECGTTDPLTYYNWAIAYAIFFGIGNYLLLGVVVWVVNSLLRERLGSGQGVYHAICIVILSFMGALTCGYVGLQSYNNWTLTPDGWHADADTKGEEEVKLAMAYYVLYMLSVLASGALSIVTLLSMRSKRIPIGGLLGWVIALIFCMFFWVLLIVVEFASLLPGNTGFEMEVYQALDYVLSFFQTFSYIVLLFLAKSRAWDNMAVQNPDPNMYQNPTYPPAPVQYGQAPPNQQQYGYSGQPGQPGQQYYYQGQPVYNVPAPVSGHKA